MGWWGSIGGGGGGGASMAPLAKSGSIGNDESVVLSAEDSGVSWDGLINGGWLDDGQASWG